MLWFRVAAAATIGAVLVWSVGEASGIISMFSWGSQTKSMVDDPSRNGTVTIYVMLCLIEFFMALAALFGLFIAFRMWRNNFQIDHSLRHLFILWLGGWAVGCVVSISISIYMIIKAKDNQENMAILYDTFQRNAQDQKFVSTLEKYQRENQCCGVYTPDDWLMLQLRQAPAAGGGGGGFQSLDYGFRQNPSTGKCHMVPPSIPPGCGLKIWDEIQSKLKLFAACSIGEVIVCGIAGALSWYCFFYWLEKEVIVIPEDEVSNVIIIEPESEATVVAPGSAYLSPSGYLSRSRSRTSYLQSMSRRSDNNNFSRRDSIEGSGIRMSHYGSKSPGSRYLQASQLHGSVSKSHHQGPHLIHLSRSAILKEQEEALGGKVLAEMHIEHKKTKMLQPNGSNGANHHATIALVRNKHPPKPQEVLGKKGHHGQTGNLAQDIAGGNARGYIEDVVVPLEPPGVKPHPIQIPIGQTLRAASKAAEEAKKKSRLGVANHDIGALDIQNIIEDVIAPQKKIPSIVAPHHEHEHEHEHHHEHHSRIHELEHAQYLPSMVSQNRYLNGSTVPHDGYLHDGGPHHEHDIYLEDGGHHNPEHDRYLQDGGHHHHHEHDRYLHDGGHHHHHHEHDRYLQDGGHHHHHEHDRYLHDGGHHHEHDRYLHDGGHHQHEHHHDRYLHDGGHHQHHGEHAHPNHHHHEHHVVDQHSRSGRRREFPTGKTTILFKNSKPLDEND